MISLVNGSIMQKKDFKEKYKQFESELQIKSCLLDLLKKSKVSTNTFDKMMYERP